METITTVSTRPDSAEYTTSLRQLTEVLTEAWSSIVSDWANRSQEVTRLCNALFEFQDRFPVTLVVIAGNSLLTTGSVYLRVSHPSTPSFNILRTFLQTLSNVSIQNLLRDDNIIPDCSICLMPFKEQLAQAPSVNNNRENQPCSTEMPTETAGSTETPVKLPCGHIFGTECIYQWMTQCGGQDQLTCPLCRTVFECANPLETSTECYVEVIPVLCPEILDPGRDMAGLLRELTVAIDERKKSEG